jgi:hypothetical protein
LTDERQTPAASISSETCRCASLPDLAGVPMGGEGLDEKVFSTVRPLCNHGAELWWLYLARCGACGQHWMVAQEERIFDAYFMRRLDAAAAQEIEGHARWPEEFITYERVLKIGRKWGPPARYFDAMAGSLVDTAADLRKERPDIGFAEIAHLLGISTAQVARLLSKSDQAGASMIPVR